MFLAFFVLLSYFYFDWAWMVRGARGVVQLFSLSSAVSNRMSSCSLGAPQIGLVNFSTWLNGRFFYYRIASGFTFFYVGGSFNVRSPGLSASPVCVWTLPSFFFRLPMINWQLVYIEEASSVAPCSASFLSASFISSPFPLQSSR